MKRLIRLPEVISTTGLSRSEIYRLEALGRFPKRVPLSERTTTWDADEVQEWVRAKIAQREQAARARMEAGQRLTASRTDQRQAA